MAVALIWQNGDCDKNGPVDAPIRVNARISDFTAVHIVTTLIVFLFAIFRGFARAMVFVEHRTIDIDSERNNFFLARSQREFGFGQRSIPPKIAPACRCETA